MDRIRLKDKEFELFIPEEEIKDAIAKVAEQYPGGCKRHESVVCGNPEWSFYVYCRVDASVERTV